MSFVLSDDASAEMIDCDVVVTGRLNNRLLAGCMDHDDVFTEKDSAGLAASRRSLR